jgi:3-hydroxyacyl-[acyl-carrier-protein] dehydratase
MNNKAFSELILFDELERADSDAFKLKFSINRASHVFDGHFPNQPILPGVVMVEMTKRASELALKKKLNLQTAGNFKFLKMVSPDEITHAEFVFTLTEKEGAWRIKAQLVFEDEIYYKADAIYIEADSTNSF